MKEGMNEIEAAMELVKAIAGEERGVASEIPAEKYYLELYAKCFKTVKTAKVSSTGVF